MTDEDYFFNLVPDVYEEYRLAIDKHPDFTHQGPPVQIVMEELGEVCKALNDGEPDHAKVEILQTIGTLVRTYRFIDMQHNTVIG